jgi:hypothetical protein
MAKYSNSTQRRTRENRIFFLVMVGLLGWIVPGGGHFIIKEKKRALIIFTTIVLTFFIGLYAGSIGIINRIDAKAWYLAQIMNSPIVAALGHVTAAEPQKYRVFGKPNEIGQIYTSIAGLLNLLCIVNAVYMAHLQGKSPETPVPLGIAKSVKPGAK